MPVVTPKTRMKGGDETFVSDPSRFYWVFYAMFFVILYTLGLVALYTTNTELIGFGIFFAIQVLLAGTIIYSHLKDGFKDFKYNKDDPKNNVIFNNHFGSIFGFLKPLFNINIAIMFEIIMLFVSLLLILITYGGINKLYATFGITSVTNLSDVPNTNQQSSIIHEKDNFKVILIVLSALMVCLLGMNKSYDKLGGILTSF